MPTINPALVPTVPPGSLFNEFTTDANISIRFLTALDPVYFEALNRPMADIALRQLILAKTLDQLNLRLGHQAIFPYLIQPILAGSISQIPVPLGLIWDMHVSLPAKWQQLRLARIKRLDGSDGIGSNDADASGSSGQGLTGHIRLMFTAVEEASPSTELFVLQADYQINPPVGQIYQVARVSVPTLVDAPNVISAGESQTVDGFIVFRTQDVTDPAIQEFFNNCPPPTSSHDITAGGAPDFTTVAPPHGTGMLIASAWNAIPNIDSDLQIFLSTLNYPFGLDANRTSTSPVTNIVIPQALFREFNIVAPASDEPSGDTSGNFWPVWVSRIQRNDTSANELEFFFSTYAVTDVPSTAPVEFASLTLDRTMTAGQIVAILPTMNLLNHSGTDANDFLQGFGKGHVVLSALWTGPTGNELGAFFDSFIPVIDVPAEVLFPKPNTRLSSWAISRVPPTVPTAGQSKAARGSRDGVAAPNALNRYVVEADQGLGDKVDFAVDPALDPAHRNNSDIERYGFTGGLAHKCVFLGVNSSGTNHDYPNDILPRLTILLGRAPQFGDFWYDGVRLKFFNGDTWQG